MKKNCFILVTIIMFLCYSEVFAKEEVHIYLFYGDTCRICEEERQYLNEVKNNYSNVIIHEFEVYNNEENKQHMTNIKNMYNIHREGVPFTVVGDNSILGYNNSSRKKLEKYIDKYSKEDYYDKVGVYLGIYQDEEISDEAAIDNSSSAMIVEQDEENTNITYKYIILISFLLIALFVIYKRKLFFKRNTN